MALDNNYRKVALQRFPKMEEDTTEEGTLVSWFAAANYIPGPMIFSGRFWKRFRAPVTTKLVRIHQSARYTMDKVNILMLFAVRICYKYLI